MNKKYFEVDSLKPFSQSLIWQLNRNFYQDKGIEAWSEDIVPHHMTSNSRVGRTYAELIYGFLKDRAAQRNPTDIVYILELGAGHGRLAFHILKHLEKIVGSSSVAVPPYCYLLSDIAESNLTFLQDHLQLKTFSDLEKLDFTYFDAVESTSIHLRIANKNLEKNDISQPIIGIANYFFDSIPTDLFLVQKGRMAECKVAVRSTENPAKVDNDTLINNLNLNYEKKETLGSYYNNPVHNEILNDYKNSLAHSHLYFPEKGMNCIQNLKDFSPEGMMLISMDKGFHEIKDLDKKGEPDLVAHGSFSIWVNFHALGEYCDKMGGLTFFPSSSTFNMDIACLLLLDNNEKYENTHSAFEQHINDFGPDDFNSLKKMAYFNVDKLTTKELIAFFRLSAYDSTFFINLLPRLKQVLTTISVNERTRIKETLYKIWDMYFSINEPYDLAYEMAGIFYDLGYYESALTFFKHSSIHNGPKADIYYNQVLCYYQLRQDEMFYKTLDKAKLEFPSSQLFDSLANLDMN